MRVLSLGAGVQSSTLLLMACEGEIAIDAAVFSDTGWEPAAVYEWLGETLMPAALKAGIPLDVVGGGNIRERSLGQGRKASLPVFLRQPDGSVGMGRRQCTNEYKVRPVQRWLRAHGATRKKPVELLLGISTDEYTRMSTSRVQYVRHAYPLIDRRMNRQDCVRWLEAHGYAEPPKSPCIGCPFRRNAEWRKLTPAEFADAVDFDRAIRHAKSGKGFTGEQFLHRSAIPLDMVDLRSDEDRGQMPMFGGADGCDYLCPADDQERAA